MRSPMTSEIKVYFHLNIAVLTTVNPAFGNLRLENYCEFKVRLCYIVSSVPG